MKPKPGALKKIYKFGISLTSFIKKKETEDSLLIESEMKQGSKLQILLRNTIIVICQ